MLPVLLGLLARGLVSGMACFSLGRQLVSGMACFSLGRQLDQGAAGVLASGLVRA